MHVVGAPEQIQPGSSVHVALHPSPDAVLPWSHVSPSDVLMTPSPQRRVAPATLWHVASHTMHALWP
jgi:hypothetical protein